MSATEEEKCGVVMRERPDIMCSMPKGHSGSHWLAAMSATEDRREAMSDEQDTAGPGGLLEAAWGIIANAHGGDWSKATPEWREAAERWRDEWHATLTP